MRSNKQRANGLCPLIDYGVPKGDVWVVTKKAHLPYTIEEMGTGVEGKMNLLARKREQAAKDQKAKDDRYGRAMAAFQGGAGHLLDEIKKDPDIVVDRTREDEQRQALLFPSEPPATRLKHLWQAMKLAAKQIWDSAQPND